MPALGQSFYRVRPAELHEVGLVSYLRLASLICLEMTSHPLQAIRTLMSRLPDVDADLVAAGRYFVADSDGDLLGGAGWSLLPLSYRGEGLVDAAGFPTRLEMSEKAVLLRGFFLDPDLGREGAAAALFAQIEAEAARAGHAAVELVGPASSQAYYRSLGFKPGRRLGLRLGRGDVLPLLQMRKGLPLRLAVAA